MNTKTNSQPSDRTEASKAAGGDCVSRLVVPLPSEDEYCCPICQAKDCNPKYYEVAAEVRAEGSDKAPEERAELEAGFVRRISGHNTLLVL